MRSIFDNQGRIVELYHEYLCSLVVLDLLCWKMLMVTFTSSLKGGPAKSVDVKSLSSS